jgi:hypothetical protein
MSFSRFTPVALALLLLGGTARAAPDYSVRTLAQAPPAELHESIRKLLRSTCIQVKDPDGKAIFELWLRATVPVRATEAQVKNGLTYREVPLSTLIGALRFVEERTDYRKQKIPAGVCTLRLALQPVSDDHTNTAPYRDFCLLCSAGDDRSPDLMSARRLQVLSARVGDEHPAVLLLFPGKGATATPKLVDRGKGHRVLLFQLAAQAGEHKATLPMGLTLIGTSAAR